MGHWDARKGRLRLHACGESDTGAALGKWCHLVVKMRSKHCVWPVCHTVGFPTPRGLGIKTLGSDRSRVKWRRIISADVLAFVTKTWSVFGAAPLKKKKTWTYNCVCVSHSSCLLSWKVTDTFLCRAIRTLPCSVRQQSTAWPMVIVLPRKD